MPPHGLINGRMCHPNIQQLGETSVASKVVWKQKTRLEYPSKNRNKAVVSMSPTTSKKRNTVEVKSSSNGYSIVLKRPKLDILASSSKTIVLSVPGSAPSTPVDGNITPPVLQSEETQSTGESVESNLGVSSSTGNQPTAEEIAVVQQARNEQTKNQKKIIAGRFDVLHVTDDDDEPAFIVRNLEKNDFALCREINVEKYQHYVKVRQRLTEFPLSADDESLKIEQKIWPDDMELFIPEDDKKFYIVAPRHYGTLHSYVIDKKKLSEAETYLYYRQILEIVAFCHERGIVVRDVKLRKFVFVDERRRRIRLDDLDELMVCDTVTNDSMSDRHGCPAYVSPEILDLTTKDYAGKPADVWGLGVLLYVLLMGRYPFYDTTPSGLFGKIRTAKLFMSEQCGVSLELRWLIRSLLRKSPEERPTVHEIFAHPWLSSCRSASKFKYGDADDEVELAAPVPYKSLLLPVVEDTASDQCVPSLEPSFLPARKQQRVETVRDQQLESGY